MGIFLTYLIIGIIVGLATIFGFLATCWICYSLKGVIRKSLNVALFFTLCLYDAVFIYPAAKDLILRILT